MRFAFSGTVNNPRAYRIDAGLYRLVCRNGLVVADGHFAHVAIRHFDVSAEKFAAAAQLVAENTPRVLDTVARWQSVQLGGLPNVVWPARERNEVLRLRCMARSIPENRSQRCAGN